MTRRALVVVLAAAAALTSDCARGGVMADLILLHGGVWTGNPDHPRAEAVAILADRILAVGTARDVKALIGKKTRVVDLEGALVVPGFIDSHTHFLNGGFSLRSVQLREVTSREEFAARIASKARELGKGAWVLNGEWDHEHFKPPVLPTKEWIDAATPDNPVFVNRLDGHMALANSLALRLAGIDRTTPAPPGGEIIKDPLTGEPTGILKDAAADLVYRVVPEPSFAEKLQAAELSLRHAAERGVTSVHEMADVASLEVYQELDKQGKMTARLAVYIPISEVDAVIRLRLRTPFGGAFVRLAGLKGFVDGSLGSSTAFFFEPYADDPTTHGLLHGQMFPEGIMARRIAAADRAGLQVAVHAIGDRANAMLLDIFEAVARENGPRDRRFRIEHAQHLRPGDIPRFGRLGVIASVQPYHAIDDGQWAETKIGSQRARTTYAFRSLLDGGAVLACGSDWTVAPLDPIQGIYAAVTRATLDGRRPGGWVPEQRISVEEAVRGYTASAAFAEFAEGEKGTLEKGKLADLVVLDRDIFAAPPERIPEARVKLTIVGGRIVYERP